MFQRMSYKNLGQYTAMNNFCFSESPSEKIVMNFCNMLKDEFIYRKEKGLDYVSFQSYLSNLFDRDLNLIRAGVIGYAQRLGPLLFELRNSPENTKRLSAGGGYGTESILLSSLGKEFIGVELVKKRADLAVSRIEFYQSLSDKKIKLNFINSHILRFLDNSCKFDIIWAMEAISHIYPLEDFLAKAYEKLNHNGKLIVSDPNKINPLALFRSMKIRGSVFHKTHQNFLDPDTHLPVDYSQEKIYSVKKLKKILKSFGFIIENTLITGFLGTSLLPKSILIKKQTYDVLKKIKDLPKNTPFIRHFGSLYTITARKES